MISSAFAGGKSFGFGPERIAGIAAGAAE